MEENPISSTPQQQRQTQQVDFGENFGQTSTLPPDDGNWNYRSCGSGISQAGFATLTFLYEVETNVSMSASTFLTARQQEKQEQQLEFLESRVFPETLSTALLERLQEKICGYTFYQPVLEVISISSGKDDEVWDTCNMTLVESRSCTRYVGSLLIGVNNTSILGSVTTKVAKHVLPVVAADMFEGWYAQWMTDKLASLPLEIDGDPDYVGGIKVTKVNYLGVPIFSETSASEVKDNGKLTGWGIVLLLFALWLLFSIACWGYYVYSNILEVDEEEDLVEQKMKTTERDNNNDVNGTFTLDEEDEEDARKYSQPPAAHKERSNSYDESYARRLPYKYSDEVPPPPQTQHGFSRVGILPIEVPNTHSKQPATPLQTPQATRSPMAHRRVQSAGNNNDFYQFHPPTPGGSRPANDPRFISVTPQDPLSRVYETPASPPRLSYRDYQPDPPPYQPYGASSTNSITESYHGGGGYNNYSLDQTYHLTHRLPSSFNNSGAQELLNSSLPEWASPHQVRPRYDDDDYHYNSRSRQPGTTTTVVDSRGQVRKEIAL